MTYIGTCDWGDCDDETVALRYWPGEGWLSVCQLHMDQGNPEDVIPLPGEIDDEAAAALMTMGRRDD